VHEKPTTYFIIINKDPFSNGGSVEPEWERISKVFKTLVGGVMSREIRQWLIASTVGGLGVVGLLLSSPLVLPGDPTALLRYVIIRVIAVLIGLTALSGGMLFVDFITPDDWMDGIGKDHTASAILMSAVVLVIGAILCWT
jgi:hypothetical protein